MIVIEHVNRNDIVCIENYLKTNFNFEILDEESIKYKEQPLANIIKTVKQNIKYYIKSNNLNVKKSDIKIYKLISKFDNDKLLSQFYDDNIFGSKHIIVVIDLESEYIYSSSGKMHSLLQLLRGFSEKDIINNTIRYKAYMFYLEMYPDLEKIISNWY
ncbi:MAG: hypothetical protein U9N10_06310 [Bacillota bacterium]|nr:hypothetical protein [Bacillota bacterium]